MNTMSSQTMTLSEKFLNSVIVTIIARATILAAPLVMSFMIWLIYQVYSDIRNTQTVQGQQIIEIQKELLEHQFRLDNGKQSRVEFQQSTEKQFARLDTQLSDIAAKIAIMNNAVIRVQTVLETRLPIKEGRLQ